MRTGARRWTRPTASSSAPRPTWATVSAAFQSFAEQTGRRCIDGCPCGARSRRGFTNSGGKSGDKLTALVSLVACSPPSTTCTGSAWVWARAGTFSAGSENDLNRLSFFLGAGAQTDIDAELPGGPPRRRRTCRASRVAGRHGQRPAQSSVAPLVQRLQVLEHRRHQLTGRWDGCAWCARSRCRAVWPS